MSGQINLREIFFNRLRSELFRILTANQLRGWDGNTVISIVDEAIRANNQRINSYLSSHAVMLLNMEDHMLKIINEILLPYLSQKKV